MSEVKSTVSVATLQTLYANSLSSTLDGQLLLLEGFYFQKNGRLYGKYFYDEIVGKDKQHRITTQLTSAIRETIEVGKYYQFEGFLNKAQSISNDSKLNVLFTITKVVKHEKKVQLISKVEYDIIQARFERDFPLIDDILLSKIENGLTPSVDIITGVQSTSKDDYMSQLQDVNSYNIRHHKCNLSSKKDIVEFISSFDFRSTDLLIILRGGGSGLEVFNEIELCKKAIELPIPFITGIGHDADKTLLEKVADRGFSTPTAVGAFLQNVVNTHKNRIQILKSKDEDLERFKKQAENEKLLLSNQIHAQKKSLNVIKTLVFVLILLVCFLAYKFYFN